MAVFPGRKTALPLGAHAAKQANRAGQTKKWSDFLE
jgi:hypothetical protein